MSLPFVSVGTAQVRFEEIRAVIAALPPEEICSVMTRLNAKMTPGEDHIPDDLLRRSMHCGKDYYTQYTLFKLLDECGLLEDDLADYPHSFP